MRQRDVDRLDDMTPRREGLYLEDIPKAHEAAFWTFAGPQWVSVRPDGRHLMPDTIWVEYLEWLRVPGNSPAKVTEDSRGEWLAARPSDDD